MRTRRLISGVLVIAMLLFTMGGVAVAKAPANSTGSTLPANVQSRLAAATRMAGLAELFMEAAAFFNAGGYDGIEYDIPLKDLSDAMHSMHYYLALAIDQASATPPDAKAVLTNANTAFRLAEYVKNTIEARVHEVGRSAGEYKHVDPEKGVFILGSDVTVCYNAQYELATEGIMSDVYLDVPLASIDLDKYKTMVFDPEYAFYGRETIRLGMTPSGLVPTGRYGGLRPTDDDLLESRIAEGKLGLVYMEPYPVSEYTHFGQIPFLAMDFNGLWVGDPSTYNVALPSHPLALDVPSSFQVLSHAQWDSLDILPSVPATNKEVVVTMAGPTVFGFNYGLGRVVVLGADTAGYPHENLGLAQVLANSAEWVAGTP